MVALHRCSDQKHPSTSETNKNLGFRSQMSTQEFSWNIAPHFEASKYPLDNTRYMSRDMTPIYLPIRPVLNTNGNELLIDPSRKSLFLWWTLLVQKGLCLEPKEASVCVISVHIMYLYSMHVWAQYCWQYILYHIVSCCVVVSQVWKLQQFQKVTDFTSECSPRHNLQLLRMLEDANADTKTRMQNLLYFALLLMLLFRLRS